jgi:hypothetical protein
MPAYRIQSHTRPKSAQVVAGYICEADKWTKSGLDGVGVLNFGVALKRAAHERRNLEVPPSSLFVEVLVPLQPYRSLRERPRCSPLHSITSTHKMGGTVSPSAFAVLISSSTFGGARRPSLFIDFHWRQSPARTQTWIKPFAGVRYLFDPRHTFGIVNLPVLARHFASVQTRASVVVPVMFDAIKVVVGVSDSLSASR